MAANQAIVKYFKEQVNAGFGKEEIYQALLTAGWTKEQINEAIYEVMNEEHGGKPPTEKHAGAKPPSKSHSVRNALVIMVVIFALIGALFIYLFYYS